jgi:hypothetical protein
VGSRLSQNCRLCLVNLSCVCSGPSGTVWNRCRDPYSVLPRGDPLRPARETNPATASAVTGRRRRPVCQSLPGGLGSCSVLRLFCQLEIAFSTPIQDPPSGTHVALRLEAGGSVGSEPCQKVRTNTLDCRFPGLTAMPPMTATLLLPRSIRSPAGKPVTLLAANLARVEFQP